MLREIIQYAGGQLPGDPLLRSVPAALADPVDDVLGVAVDRLPITPSRLWEPIS